MWARATPVFMRDCAIDLECFGASRRSRLRPRLGPGRLLEAGLWWDAQQFSLATLFRSVVEHQHRRPGPLVALMQIPQIFLELANFFGAMRWGRGGRLFRRVRRRCKVGSQRLRHNVADRNFVRLRLLVEQLVQVIWDRNGKLCQGETALPTVSYHLLTGPGPVPTESEKALAINSCWYAARWADVTECLRKPPTIDQVDRTFGNSSLRTPTRFIALSRWVRWHQLETRQVACRLRFELFQPLRVSREFPCAV